MKRIQLTKGKYAIVDDEDYPYLSRFHWDLVSDNYVVRRITTYKKEQFLIGIEYFILGSAHTGGSRIVHKNHNPLDCRKENLEYRKNSVAVHNKRKTKNPKSSIYKGVHWAVRYQKWETKIAKDYKCIYIGRFTKEKEAAKAYNKKALELYGEYAFQNKL